jgi:PEP-CTERM motif
MRKTLLLTSGLAWLGLSGAAGAVTVSLTPGPQNPQYFASEAAGQNGFTIDGVTWTDVSGPAATEKGTKLGDYAAPLGMGASTTTGTTYMAVEGGGTEKATWATPQTSLSIYWGSIDADICGGGSSSCGNLNSVAITVDGYTLTGADLMSMYGALGVGSQGNPKDNQLVRISGLAPFTTVEFSSTRDAFEFSLGATAIPEPSTWAMMLAGFAGLGFLGWRGPRKTAAHAA